MVRFFCSVKDAKKAFGLPFILLNFSSFCYVSLGIYVAYGSHDEEAEPHRNRHSSFLEITFLFAACQMSLVCPYYLMISSVPPMVECVNKIRRAFGGKKSLAVKKMATQQVRRVIAGGASDWLC
jgi:hypothetical protein